MRNNSIKRGIPVVNFQWYNLTKTNTIGQNSFTIFKRILYCGINHHNSFADHRTQFSIFPAYKTIKNFRLGQYHY